MFVSTCTLCMCLHKHIDNFNWTTEFQPTHRGCPCLSLDLFYLINYDIDVASHILRYLHSNCSLRNLELESLITLVDHSLLPKPPRNKLSLIGLV